MPSALRMTRGRVNEGRDLDACGLAAALPRDELHIWRAELDRGPEVVTRLRGVLSADERARAQRFRFERDRSRYIVGRGLLRLLLGRYVGRSPQAIEVLYGEHEKPYLAEGPWFNVSHSGPVALIAFCADAEVGVDVELDDPGFAGERIAEHFFSPGEVQTLRSLPASLQPRAFLTCWTRKEAFIKARGDGLHLALDSFDVTLAPWQPAALLRTDWCSFEPNQWSLVDVSDREKGFIAAVASRSQARRVIHRDAAEIVDNEIVLDQEGR